MANLHTPDPSLVRNVADLLNKAQSVLFITGAGVSADSGLPTYRGVGGLYNNDNTEEGYPIEVALSGSMFAQNPGLVWRYILQIERACRGHTFNRAHAVIADLETNTRVWTLTQNVDGFHRKAGSHNVIDIHGDIHQLDCTSCDWTKTVEDYSALQTANDAAPLCPKCNSVIRPDVVLFDEQLPPHKLDRLRTELATGFDLIFSIGTTSVFPYIAYPIHQARRDGIPTVEINPGHTEVTQYVDFAMKSGAAVTLDAIHHELTQLRSTQ